jgi:arylsulfatase A-like enzyme
LLASLGLFAASGFLGCDRGDRTAAQHPRVGVPIHPPNVLLYVVDTLRADALGCYGNEIVDTPAIDRLASEGVLFEAAFSQSSWTRSSIASILTSAYPEAHGALNRSDALSQDATLLSERLRDAEYHTAFIVTNPNVGSSFGFKQGFDTFDELYSRREPGYVEASEIVTPSDALVDHTIQWIESSRSPFFITVLAIDPHSPYEPPADFDRYGGDYSGLADGTHRWINRKRLSAVDRQRIRSLYLAEVAFMDREFGRLVDHLRGMGILDQTIVVLTSDHGEALWEHGRRGHGTSLFDEQTKVPLVVRYPPRVTPSGRRDDIVESIDIGPTIFDLAGLPADPQLQGRSLFGEDRTTHAYSNLEIQGNSLKAVRSRRWKLIRNTETGSVTLYDLVSSDAEHFDVASSHPAVVEQLQAKLDRHVSTILASPGAVAPDRRERVEDAQVPALDRQLLRKLGYMDADQDDALYGHPNQDAH